MAFPAFFDQVPSIRMYDGLSQLLGATPDGIIEYRYADAVRLAGHSCPTVASAWLCAWVGLRELYVDDIPERGGVSVFLEGAQDEGVTGVIGQVLTLVTGAAADNGFHGLAGQYVRRGLLHYATAGLFGVRMRRNDTGVTIEVLVDPRTVPADPAQGALLQAVIQGTASDAQRRQFGQVWQDRVRRLLVDHAHDPNVIHVRTLQGDGASGTTAAAAAV